MFKKILFKKSFITLGPGRYMVAAVAAVVADTVVVAVVVAAEAVADDGGTAPCGRGAAAVVDSLDGDKGRTVALKSAWGQHYRTFYVSKIS
jgi:hypothetical protein